MDYLSGLDLNSAVSDVDEEAKKATTANLQRIAGHFLKELTGDLSDDPVAAKRQTDEMLARLTAGDSIFAAPVPTTTTNAPLALGPGSPVTTPAAPVAPAAPSQEEQIGTEFLKDFNIADLPVVLGFLKDVRNTGISFDHATRALVAIGTVTAPGQLVAYVEQLVGHVRSGRETLQTDPTNSVVKLKSMADLTTQHKNDILALASAIAGSTVTISTGTQPVVQSAIRNAEKLLRERTELVDAIHGQFGVSLMGGQSMTAFVAAAKAAATSATTPIPAVTAVIDLLAEINHDTNLNKGSDTDRAYADRIKTLIREALAAQEIGLDMATNNGFGGVRVDMGLLDITHALYTALAGRRMPTTVYTVPAKPVI